MARGQVQQRDMVLHVPWEALLKNRLPLHPVPDLCERYDTRRREERAVKHQRNNPEGLDVNEETTVALSYFLRRWVSKGSWGVCVSCLGARRVQFYMRRLT